MCLTPIFYPNKTFNYAINVNGSARASFFEAGIGTLTNPQLTPFEYVVLNAGDVITIGVSSIDTNVSIMGNPTTDSAI
jgi:hypothetical protein